MEVIRFDIEGMINSFRRIETATYQNTELTPKKTHIAGMITNILGKGERFYYEILPQIKVSVIPLQLENIFVDVWQYKKWKIANQGRAVVKREKLYHAKYRVYVMVQKKYYTEILKALKKPKRPPSLGMDDELVEIKNIRTADIESIATDKHSKIEISSTFPEDWVSNYDFSIDLAEGNLIIPPRVATAVLVFNRGPPRVPTKTIRIVEFFGGNCNLKIKVDGVAYREDGKNLILW